MLLRIVQNLSSVSPGDTKTAIKTVNGERTDKHPMIRSLEPGEEWGFCYPDDLFYETLPV